jgi:hypothetical protein
MQPEQKNKTRQKRLQSFFCASKNRKIFITNIPQKIIVLSDTGIEKITPPQNSVETAR